MSFIFDLQRFADLNITRGGTYNIDSSYSSSTITINTTAAVTLKGDNSELTAVQIVVSADTGNLTIEDLSITNQTGSVVQFGEGTDNQLNVAGTNVFEVVAGMAAAVNVGGGLTVNGTGSLKATTLSGACIGVNGSESRPTSNITVESGTFDLTARSGSCGIGGAGALGNAIGDITITGTANVTASTPNGYGAAIGSCYRGSMGNILIDGNAIVNATTGQHAAAIGAAPYTENGTITITGNANVTATNISEVDDSAAIGSGYGAQAQTVGDIVISGNANVTASSNLGLAIDNIEWIRESLDFTKPDPDEHSVANDDATITISENATFNGSSGDIFTATTINGEEFTAATITYSNGTLTYEGGSSADDSVINSTLLEITSGGTYTLASDSVGKILIETTDAVTINGNNASLSNIQIITNSDSANLTIRNLNVTNLNTSVIQFGSGSGNKLTLTGSNSFTVNKGNKAAINIGGGVEIGGSGSLDVVTLSGACIGVNGEQDLSGSNITINDGTFNLKARSGASAIGGAGNGSKLGDITITGTANITANTPMGYAAAIGSAYRGTVGDITVDGDATITASTGPHAAAIGSSTFCDNGDITIYLDLSTTSTDYHSAALGATTDDQAKSLGNITIGENATVYANSASGLAIDNILFTETTFSNVANTKTISINQNDGDKAYVAAHNGVSVAAPSTDYVTINGTAISGDTDLIFYSANSNVTLPSNSAVAAEGDVFVNNTGNNVYIATGENNDTINSTGENVTINAGGGEDVLSSYDENSTIVLNGSLTSATVDGSDVILITENDTVTVEDAAGRVLNLSYNDSVSQVMYGQRWSTIDGGGFRFTAGSTSYTGGLRPDKYADFTLSGGNLVDEDNDEKPDNLATGAVIYVPASGVHTNVRNLSGNVVYNGDYLGVEGDTSYNIEAVSPIDVSETLPGVYITEPHTTAMRGISDGATVSQRLEDYVDWYSLDNDATVRFMDGVYCGYTEATFSTRSYSEFWISNDNYGMDIYSTNDLFTTISNLKDGYSVTIAGGVNIGDEVNFKTEGSGTIVVLSTADTGKYSLSADQFESQSFTLSGDTDFNIIFGENNSVVGFSNFDGTGTVDETGTWNTLEGGGFEFHAFVQNDITKTTDFTISGADLTDEDNDGAPDNVSVPIIRSVGSMIRDAIFGLSGEVTINGESAGVSGDDNYDIHFTSDPYDGGSKAFMSISSGASIDANGYTNEAIVTDDTADIHIQDGGYRIAGASNYSPARIAECFETVSVDNSNRGAGVSVVDGFIAEISGLIDGYNFEITTGENIGDSLNFKTDGGSGSLQLGSTNYILSGDSDFGFEFDEDGAVTGLVNFSGVIESTDNPNIYEDPVEAILDGSVNFSGTGTTTVTGADGETYGVAYTAENRKSLAGAEEKNILVSEGSKVTLSSGDGGDYLINRGDKTVMIGGAGNDTFSNGADAVNATIRNYNTDEDIILFNDDLSSAKVVASNFVFQSGDQKVVVKGGASKKIEVVDSSGNSAFYGSYLSVNDKNGAKVSATSKVETIDASARTSEIYLIGNSKANTIYGGTGKNTLNGGGGDDYIVGGNSGDWLRGGGGADTLVSGTGDNTLTGGGGADLFVYGGGNDTITDYSATDTIDLGDDSITDFSFDSKNLVLNTNNGSITIRNGKNKNITVTDSSGQTSTQKYSQMASSADLFAEDNFISGTARLSDITAENYSVTEFINYETFAQDDNFAAEKIVAEKNPAK